MRGRGQLEPDSFELRASQSLSLREFAGWVKRPRGTHWDGNLALQTAPELYPGTLSLKSTFQQPGAFDPFSAARYTRVCVKRE
jgi:hypothetical protein